MRYMNDNKVETARVSMGRSRTGKDSRKTSAKDSKTLY